MYCQLILKLHLNLIYLKIHSKIKLIAETYLYYNPLLGEYFQIKFSKHFNHKKQ